MRLIRPGWSLPQNIEFTDGELSDQFRSPIGSRRDLSLFQVNFYGFLQEFILRELYGAAMACERGASAS